MKKILIFLSVLTLLFIPGTAFAQNSSKNQSTILTSGETVNKDYFAANAIVEISGTVNGDVYAAGGSVLIDGTVNGDVIAAGGTVNISGQVSQNVRATGGQVIISGKVGRNLTVAGGNVDVTSNATVAGSLVAAGGNLTISAPIAKSAKVAGGNVTIAASIGGDLESYSENTRLTSKGTVNGNFSYWSNNQASIESGAKVTGKVTKNQPISPAPEPRKILGLITAFAFFFKLISSVSTFILGLLLIYFLPIFTKNSVENLKSKPWQSLGIGFLALILTPIVAVILFITLLGIPLALILLVLYFIVLYLSRIFVMLWAGQEILNRSENNSGQVLALLIGLIIYAIVTIIPIIGGFVAFFVTLFGLGALLLNFRKQELAVSRSRRITT